MTKQELLDRLERIRDGVLDADKPTKKKPAKRKTERNPIVTKLLNLKYRLNDIYNDNNNTMCVDRLKEDKGYVMKLINDMREFGWPTISKEDCLKCNGLWRKYEG